MSNPYERILKPPSAKPAPRPPSEAPNPKSSSGDAQSAIAQAKKLPSTAKRPKPHVKFMLRPRFRFELPDPPMDPKMLLGRVSTTAYAKPYISDLERNFRPVAIPADPTHGLRVNLVDTAAASSSHPKSFALSVDDNALLQSVLASRHAPKKHSAEAARRPLQGLASVPPSRPASNNVPTATWMRRMSYDEYFARSGTMRHVSVLAKQREAAEKEKDKLNDPKMRDRRRKLLLSTFQTARKRPVHADPRKASLEPVRISPVFPDFSSLGENFIALEFDKDEVLTFPERIKSDPDAADEAIRSTATVSLAADSAPTHKSDKPKKYIACYTPTDETLSKRRRTSEAAEAEDSKEVKKPRIHFVDNELYEWIGEYSIREGTFGNNTTKPTVMARSCFAVEEHVGENEGRGVACFARIGTSWQLARRPFHDGTQRLGKEGLEIERDFDMPGVDSRERRQLLAGAGRQGASKIRSRKSADAEVVE